jgi:hypothetical protein
MRVREGDFTWIGVGQGIGWVDTYSDRTVRAAIVDELNDTVGVVVKVHREHLLGERVAVVGDEGLKVVGYTLGVGGAHAGTAVGSSPVGRLPHTPVARPAGSGNVGNGEKARGQDDGR